ncbi:MAG: hypothetical protein RBG13Loki_0907 [Promethearchaeota archaeon CR_4]|nr:MAG: hypothetical protein RBG13Loki_0907 [Candidatus Lokiarchaeota archaeon CR_4]
MKEPSQHVLGIFGTNSLLGRFLPAKTRVLKGRPEKGAERFRLRQSLEIFFVALFEKLKLSGSEGFGGGFSPPLFGARGRARICLITGHFLAVFLNLHGHAFVLFLQLHH